jgi:hypothetical protein
VNTFEVENATPAEFIDRVRHELSDRELNEFVEVDGDETGLVVSFRWMGSTELRYRFESTAGGFRAILERQKVSPLHAPFRQRFDDRFDQILKKVGAKTLNV